MTLSIDQATMQALSVLGMLVLVMLPLLGAATFGYQLAKAEARREHQEATDVS